MGSLLNVLCYSGCIVGGVRFHLVERDFRCTIQNSGVMVIGESSGGGSGDNNFYGVLDKMLDVQYSMRRRVWIFKCIMSSSPSSFKETDALFLVFVDEFNNAGRSPSMDDNSDGTQPSPNPRRRQQSRNLELERYIHKHALNRFVKHQMLTSFKEFRGDCHRHFKKYNDPEQARANSVYRLVGRLKDWSYLCDHYMSHAFKEKSWTNKATRQKQPYNHSSRSKSLLQQQHELTEK
ncbi:CACTA en-spm transposon protein [Cucumis melo var. makuwa]|uniref:CACTA en-spm transposon protein n=1 Tax=Cucumis melo var. makuwa TaxID=1194695 RepID=A0A5D3BZJ5_CUCMM|nr:CACTA en-spm transposon protein [Cucumis melo var. makuwa]